jgi:hypothetical protein
MNCFPCCVTPVSPLALPSAPLGRILRGALAAHCGKAFQRELEGAAGESLETASLGPTRETAVRALCSDSPAPAALKRDDSEPGDDTQPGPRETLSPTEAPPPAPAVAQHTGKELLSAQVHSAGAEALVKGAGAGALLESELLFRPSEPAAQSPGEVNTIDKGSQTTETSPFSPVLDRTLLPKGLAGNPASSELPFRTSEPATQSPREADTTEKGTQKAESSPSSPALEQPSLPTGLAIDLAHSERLSWIPGPVAQSPGEVNATDQDRQTPESSPSSPALEQPSLPAGSAVDLPLSKLSSSIPEPPIRSQGEVNTTDQDRQTAETAPSSPAMEQPSLPIGLSIDVALSELPSRVPEPPTPSLGEVNTTDQDRQTAETAPSSPALERMLLPTESARDVAFSELPSWTPEPAVNARGEVNTTEMGGQAAEISPSGPVLQRTSLPAGVAGDVAFAVKCSEAAPVLPNFNSMSARSGRVTESAMFSKGTPAGPAMPTGAGVPAVVAGREDVAGTSNPAPESGSAEPRQPAGPGILPGKLTDVAQKKDDAAAKTDGTSGKQSSPRTGSVLGTTGAQKGNIPVVAPAPSQAAHAASSASESVPAHRGAPESETIPDRAAAPEPRAVQPPGRIDLRVQGQQNERVDIRLVARGNEVQVTVKTASPALNTELRGGLQDLVQTLKDSGYQTDSWKPLLPGSPSSSASHDAGREQGRPPEGGWGGRESAPGGQQENRGGRGKQDNPPRWVEELEASSAGSPKSNWRELSWRQ